MTSRFKNSCDNPDDSAQRHRRLLERAVRRVVKELREEPEALLEDHELPLLEGADFDALAAPLSAQEALFYLPQLEDPVSEASPEELAEEVARELVRLRLVYGSAAWAPQASPPRQRRRAAVRGGKGEQAFLSLLRERDKKRAEELLEVREFRTRVLEGRLLPAGGVVRWLRERDAFRSSRALEEGVAAAVPARATRAGLEAAGEPAMLPFYPEARVALPPRSAAEEEYELAEFSVPAASSTLLFLKAVSERVAWETGWTEAEAALFVLTGIAPEYSAVEVDWKEEFRLELTGGKLVLAGGDPGGTRVTIRTWGFIPPVRVLEAFRRARKLLGTSRRTPSPRRRVLSERSRALYAFVRETAGLPWEERLERWNERYPHWAYHHSSNMRSAYARARRVLQEE